MEVRRRDITDGQDLNIWVRVFFKAFLNVFASRMEPWSPKWFSVEGCTAP